MKVNGLGKLLGAAIVADAVLNDGEDRGGPREKERAGDAPKVLS